MLQLEPTATEPPAVHWPEPVAIAKSEAFVPDGAEMLVMFKKALLGEELLRTMEFVTVVLSVWLPKFMVAGEGRLATGPLPVPLMLSVWVLPAVPLELSVMVNVAESEPGVAGVKVRVMVQEFPAASELPQLLA